MRRLAKIGFMVLSTLVGGIGVKADTDTSAAKIPVAMIGMVHGHVNAWLRSDYPSEFELVGIYEPDPAVAAKYRKRYSLDDALFYTDLNAMLDERKPAVAWVFTNTYAHERAVAACAPRKVNVIVEKPLAVNLASGRRMAALAEEHGIHLLTNLETSWHPSVQRAVRAAKSGELGNINRIVTYHGHRGPVAIECPREFLEWLTDPVLNGGGASTDFGCYGANWVTHLMDDQRPLSVTAIYQTQRPELYPRVDDDATILLVYPGFQVLLQASWNWPYARKEIHLYGEAGALRTIDSIRYDLRLDPSRPFIGMRAQAQSQTVAGAVPYFSAILRGELDPAGSRSSLTTNLIAVEIIDAAAESARTGTTFVFDHRQAHSGGWTGERGRVGRAPK